jgi:hypothetical protein
MWLPCSNKQMRLSSWITDTYGLQRLTPYATDKAFQAKWREVKQENKAKLAAYIKSQFGDDVPLNALFDIQVGCCSLALVGLATLLMRWTPKHDGQRTWSWDTWSWDTWQPDLAVDSRAHHARLMELFPNPALCAEHSTHDMWSVGQLVQNDDAQPSAADLCCCAALVCPPAEQLLVIHETS